MKRAHVLLLVGVIAGCAADDVDANAEASATLGGTDATDGTTTTATTVSTTATTTVATSEGTGGATSLGTTTDVTATGTDTGTTGGAASCLPELLLTALDEHVQELDASASLLATHASASEAVGFLSAPGLPTPPAIPAVFAGLVMPCTDALEYEPFCEEGRCSQIECTGAGAGWVNHYTVMPPLVIDGWSFEQVNLDVRWTDADEDLLFEIETRSTAPGGIDASMSGNGEMRADGLRFTERFPALHPAGLTVLQYDDDDDGFSGSLMIDGVVVADIDASGRLMRTGDCPGD